MLDNRATTMKVQQFKVPTMYLALSLFLFVPHHSPINNSNVAVVLHCFMVLARQSRWLREEPDRRTHNHTHPRANKSGIMCRKGGWRRGRPLCLLYLHSHYSLSHPFQYHRCVCCQLQRVSTLILLDWNAHLKTVPPTIENHRPPPSISNC